MTRPDRDTVLRLLAADGQMVTVREHELTEDVDGDPLGVRVDTTTAMLYVTPELLGWTAEELEADQ